MNLSALWSAQSHLLHRVVLQRGVVLQHPEHIIQYTRYCYTRNSNTYKDWKLKHAVGLYFYFNKSTHIQSTQSNSLYFYFNKSTQANSRLETFTL